MAGGAGFASWTSGTKRSTRTWRPPPKGSPWHGWGPLRKIIDLPDRQTRRTTPRQTCVGAEADSATGSSAERAVIEDSPRGDRGVLRPRPIREIPGVGARTAAILNGYGLHTVGDVANVPALTLQRLLGARAGRTLHERAHGRDATTVDPTPAPVSLSAEHRFDRDELDPAQHRRALLALADDLGTRLRSSHQIAQALTCTIRYADQSATRRTRTLPEATQHTVVLARAAYEVYASLGLQRARVRSIALRADTVQHAAKATRQLTLDAGDDRVLAIEAIADLARARFGHSVLYPATLAIGGSHTRGATVSTAVTGSREGRTAG